MTELILIKKKELLDIFEVGILPYLETKDVLSLLSIFYKVNRLLEYNKLTKTDINHAIKEGFKRNESLSKLLKVSPTLEYKENLKAFDYIINNEIDEHPICVKSSAATISDIKSIFLHLKKMKCCFELSTVKSMKEFEPQQGYGRTYVVEQLSEELSSRFSLLHLAEETVVKNHSGSNDFSLCPFSCDKCERVKCLCRKDGECRICKGQFCWCGDVRTCNSCSYGVCRDCYIRRYTAGTPVRDFRQCRLCATYYCTKSVCIDNLSFCCCLDKYACAECSSEAYKVCDSCDSICCEESLDCSINYCQDCDKFTCWNCDKVKCEQCGQPFSTKKDVSEK